MMSSIGDHLDKEIDNIRDQIYFSLGRQLIFIDPNRLRIRFRVWTAVGCPIMELSDHLHKKELNIYKYREKGTSRIPDFAG